MLWQTFQYLLLTVSEALVSITGLVFAYSQAPKRYKTVIMSLWYLTVAFGNLIVALVAEVHLVPNQVHIFDITPSKFAFFPIYLDIRIHSICWFHGIRNVYIRHTCNSI